MRKSRFSMPIIQKPISSNTWQEKNILNTLYTFSNPLGGVLDRIAPENHGGEGEQVRALPVQVPNPAPHHGVNSFDPNYWRQILGF